MVCVQNNTGPSPVTHVYYNLTRSLFTIGGTRTHAVQMIVITMRHILGENIYTTVIDVITALLEMFGHVAPYKFISVYIVSMVAKIIFFWHYNYINYGIFYQYRSKQISHIHSSFVMLEVGSRVSVLLGFRGVLREGPLRVNIKHISVGGGLIQPPK